MATTTKEKPNKLKAASKQQDVYPSKNVYYINFHCVLEETHIKKAKITTGLPGNKMRVVNRHAFRSEIFLATFNEEYNEVTHKEKVQALIDAKVVVFANDNKIENYTISNLKLSEPKKTGLIAMELNNKPFHK